MRVVDYNGSSPTNVINVMSEDLFPCPISDEAMCSLTEKIVDIQFQSDFLRLRI